MARKIYRHSVAYLIPSYRWTIREEIYTYEPDFDNATLDELLHSDIQNNEGIQRALQKADVEELGFEHEEVGDNEIDRNLVLYRAKTIVEK